MYYYTHPDAAVTLFCNLLSFSAIMESFAIHGSAFGKESSGPTPSQTRAILRLLAILAVADALIAHKLHQLVDAVCIAPGSVMFGARKGTQVLDVAPVAQLRSFTFNGVVTILVSLTLFNGTFPLTMTVLIYSRLRSGWYRMACMCSWLLVFFGCKCYLFYTFLLVACVFSIKSRSIRSLTGSPSAVAADRIPVEANACLLAHDWKAYGVHTDNASVSFASWVDNYFAIGSNLPGTHCGILRETSTCSLRSSYQGWQTFCIVSSNPSGTS